MRGKITREEALSFLLTHIVVEKQVSFEMNQLTLFNLMSMASQAEQRLREEQGLVRHEVIEAIAEEFINHAG
ncbi:MAG: hypothetical protein ACFHX7_11130 [Pseudomonadota bacterium]